MKSLRSRSPPNQNNSEKLTARIKKPLSIGQLIKIINPKFLNQKVMKTINLNAKANSNTTNPAVTTTVQTPALKTGSMQPNQKFDTEKPKADDKKAEIPKIAQGGEQNRPTIELTKVEAKNDDATPESKAEEKAPVQEVKPALNLDETLKLLETLHKRKVHRDNLLNIISTLDDFKVMVQDENEDIEVTQFPNCKLTIEDDNRNTFSTKNPAIIKAVADFVNSLCTSKLAEIEANIVIPS